ncbi:MAG TPA: phytanoyl-CoA dioxygenase family protein [Acidobacteriota bacterium]|nr:phytanoyl-CoA dioxygenase family protein [Acidobacteriota bacterium]
MSNKSQASQVVDDKGRMVSDLWLDQPDAPQEIEKRRQEGRITDQEAENLSHFVEKGYLAIHLDFPEDKLDQINRDVDKLWDQQPVDLAYAYREDLTSMADAIEDEERKPGYRIADLHGHSQAARDLYLDPQIFHWLELIFDQPAVAFQSLYFQWGSQQSLHRDPVYVVTQPASHLLATWVALEDIGPDCGPLNYVPGSHRMPYYQFEPGRIAIAADEDYMKAFKYSERIMKKEGLEEQLFTCKKGDCFIWHANLVHGGSLVKDASKTRRSFVVHYSTVGNYRKRGGTMKLKGGRPQPEPLWNETSEIIEQDGARGFEAPLKDLHPDNLPLKSRLRSTAKRWLRKLRG